MRRQILITGSTGFIGIALIARLAEENFNIRAIVRNNKATTFNEEVKVINVGELTTSINWKQALEGVDVVIHLASRVHIMNDQAADPTAEYQRINVDASLNLARQAADLGVKRFIYLSSIKVHGEFTELSRPFVADDMLFPQSSYAISKYQSELGLRELSIESEMEIVIIRPPLVYGPGVKANFLSMMKWLSRSIPLPFGRIHNLRSLVAIDNLVDLIVKCIDHPAAANQAFLVSDGEDLSTPDLLYRMGVALDKPVRLIPIPVLWLQFFSYLFGFDSTFERLCSSLQVDISKTQKLLGWDPIIGVDEGLRRAAQNLKIK